MRTSMYVGSLVALLLVHAAIVSSALPEPVSRRAAVPCATELPLASLPEAPTQAPDALGPDELAALPRAR